MHCVVIKCSSGFVKKIILVMIFRFFCKSQVQQRHTQNKNYQQDIVFFFYSFSNFNFSIFTRFWEGSTRQLLLVNFQSQKILVGYLLGFRISLAAIFHKILKILGRRLIILLIFMKVFMRKLLVFWIFTKSLISKFTRFLEKVLVCDTLFF